MFVSGFSAVALMYQVKMDVEQDMKVILFQGLRVVQGPTDAQFLLISNDNFRLK